MISEKNFKFFILILFCFILLSYLHGLSKEIIFSQFTDFDYYYVQSFRLSRGENIYNNDFIGENLRRQLQKMGAFVDFNFRAFVTHSPAFFLVILPFTLLPFRSAALLWLFLSHIFLLSSVFLIIKIADGYDKRSYIVPMVLTLVFCFWPLREEIHMSNPNSAILLLLTLTLYFFKNRKPFLTGLVLSGALVFRQYFLVLFLFFLWRREYKVFFYCIFSSLAIEAISFLVWGYTVWASYWQTIHSFLGQGQSPFKNISLMGTIGRVGYGLMPANMLYLFGLICSLVILFIFLYLSRKPQGQINSHLELTFSLGVVSCIAISPWVHESHYLVLLLPIIITWLNLLKSNNSTIDKVLFLISFLALGLRYSLEQFSLFHVGIFAIFSSGKITGLMILYFLIVRLVKKSAVEGNLRMREN